MFQFGIRRTGTVGVVSQLPNHPVQLTVSFSFARQFRRGGLQRSFVLATCRGQQVVCSTQFRFHGRGTLLHRPQFLLFRFVLGDAGTGQCMQQRRHVTHGTSHAIYLGALIEFVEVVPKPRLPGLVEGEFLLGGDPKAEVTGRPDLEERLLTNTDTG